MKLNRTGSIWDRNERININDNWDIIEENANNFKNDLTDEIYSKIVESAKLSWKEPVNSYEDLPNAPTTGETRMVRTDGHVYRYDGEKWIEIQTVDVSPLNEIDSRITNRLESTENTVEDNSKKLYDSNYYQEVEVSKHFDSQSNTHYHLTIIKHKDDKDNLIKLKHSTMRNNPKKIREFAYENNATVATNASWTVGAQSLFSGVTIKDGEVEEYTELTADELKYRYILGIKPDNTLVSFKGDTSPQELLENGVDNALTAFIPLVYDSEIVSPVLLQAYHMPEKHPRQAIGQFPNKDIIFITTGGRGFDGDGMTASDVARILKSKGVYFAHMLDGGGSNSTVVRGVQVNVPIDLKGSTERVHANALYIEKPRTGLDRDKDIAIINKELGIINNKVDSKSSRLNVHSETISNLLNGAVGSITVTKTDIGLVHIQGSITIGDKGSTQTNIATIPLKYAPSIYVTNSVSNVDTPWETFTGLVVTDDGYIRLRGQANTGVSKNMKIHVNLLYRV